MNKKSKVASELQEEVIVVVGAFCTDLILWHELLDDILEAELTLSQSQLSEKGGVFHFQLETQGSWHQLAKFEIALKSRRTKISESALLHWSREVLQSDENSYLPYQVEVNSVVNPALTHVITQFFSMKDVKIKELRTQNYLQGKTQVALQSVFLSVWIPLQANLTELRENLMLLCDEYNLDVLFEQERI